MRFGQVHVAVAVKVHDHVQDHVQVNAKANHSLAARHLALRNRAL
jgi:hypothetical protein